MPLADSPRPRCLLCCAPRDEAFRQELSIALLSWANANRVEVWHRGMLLPGEEDTRCREELSTADVIVFLLSADTQAAGEVSSELDVALARHMRGSARLVPVLARPFYWQVTPIASLTVLPSEARAVTLWPNRDEAWLDVVRGIEAVFRGLSGRTDPPLQSAPFRAEAVAEQLASQAVPEALLPDGKRRTAFEWETWLFERCATNDPAPLMTLATAIKDQALAAKLREIAACIQSGCWPPGLAPVLLRLERGSAGWRADIHFGFLGQVGSIVLRPGQLAPLGMGASLETAVEDGQTVVRLLARTGSSLRGARARILSGARALTKWLVPPGSGAFGVNDDTYCILLEIPLPEEPEREVTCP